MTKLTQGQRDFLLRLPKTEQHLHFEAALPLAVAQARHGDILRPVPPFWAPEFRFEDFAHFAQVSRDYVFPSFQSPDDYLALAGPIFRDIRAQNVRYLETSINPFLLEFHDFNLDEFLAALKRQAPADMDVRVYCGFRRNAYVGRMAKIIDAAAESAEVAGLDLHGFETFALEPWTAEVWARSRAAGKRNKAHAGEFVGASSVREVVDRLKIDRVQHGVRAVEDPQLLERLAGEGIVLDLCPISNLRLKVAPSIARHQLRVLLEAGVRCTVNSDDPILFGNYITDDLAALVEEGGFTFRDMISLLKVGWEEADVDAATRARFIGELDRAALSLAADPP
ncbi:MAG TPA: adenosine deaminase [Opitutaceae bacterium]|jgi:adenosine deaminase|nr:adenosine deaminase [Opitutaceae bacterium]